MKKLFLTLGAVLVFGIASAQVNQNQSSATANRLTVQQKPSKTLSTNADPAATAQDTQNNSGVYGAPSTNNGPTMSSTTATGNGAATASPGTGSTSANTAAPASATSTSSTASKTTTTTATPPRRN